MMMMMMMGHVGPDLHSAALWELRYPDLPRWAFFRVGTDSTHLTRDSCIQRPPLSGTKRRRDGPPGPVITDVRWWCRCCCSRSRGRFGPSGQSRIAEVRWRCWDSLRGGRRERGVITKRSIPKWGGLSWQVKAVQALTWPAALMGASAMQEGSGEDETGGGWLNLKVGDKRLLLVWLQW